MQTGVLPGEGGAFDISELRGRTHYEVNGESSTEGEASTANQAPPVRFAFRRTSAPATYPPMSAAASNPAPRASGLKMLQRNIFVAELVDGALETQKTQTIKLSEFEASLPTIKAKVTEELRQEEPIVLIDSHHYQIMDSEGTRADRNCPQFWTRWRRWSLPPKAW